MGFAARNDQQLICPVAFDLDMKRIEAGLLIYGVDITGTQSPMELGLDLPVDYSKPRFLGKREINPAQIKTQKLC